MSKQKYQIWWTDDRGNRILQIEDWAFLNYARIVNGISYLNLGVPLAAYGDFFVKDYKIEVWRAPRVGEKRRLEDVYIARKPKYYTRTGDNVSMIEITSANGVSLLNERIEKFKATTSQAKKTDKIDDMMKEIVDEHMGAAAYADDPDRAVPYNLGYFRIQADGGLGATETKSFSYQAVMPVLKALHKLSQQNGPKIFFDVVPVTPSIYEFRTYSTQRGSDKRFSAGKSTLLFALKNGNLRGPQLTEDNFGEKNVVYVAGEGEGTARTVVEREDTGLSKQSIWARREMYRDDRMTSTTAGLNSTGDEELGNNRPARRFISDMLSIPGSEYGVDWDLGDRATVEYVNRLIDIQILIVYVTVTDTGEEKIYGRNEFGAFNE